MPNTCYMLYILAFTHIFLSFQMLHEICRCIGVVSALLDWVRGARAMSEEEIRLEAANRLNEMNNRP